MRQLSHITPAPNTRNNSATTISHRRTEPNAFPCVSCCIISSLVPRCEKGPRWRGPLRESALLLVQEAGFPHQVLVRLLGLRHPVQVLLARHVALVEGAVLHEFLPVRRLAH